MDSRNQKPGVVTVGKARDDTCQQDQCGSKHADRYSANPANRRILSEDSGEDFADDKELQKALEEKVGPIDAPEIWSRDERRQVRSEDYQFSQGPYDCKRKESGNRA